MAKMVKIGDKCQNGNNFFFLNVKNGQNCTAPVLSVLLQLLLYGGEGVAGLAGLQPGQGTPRQNNNYLRLLYRDGQVKLNFPNKIKNKILTLFSFSCFLF